MYIAIAIVIVEINLHDHVPHMSKVGTNSFFSYTNMPFTNANLTKMKVGGPVLKSA